MVNIDLAVAELNVDYFATFCIDFPDLHTLPGSNRLFQGLSKRSAAKHQTHLLIGGVYSTAVICKENYGDSEQIQVSEPQSQ